jgi:hypothetical protein
MYCIAGRVKEVSCNIISCISEENNHKKKQRKQMKSLCSGKGSTQTSTKLEVAKLIGCFDKFKVGDGMMTAMERAGDELGMTVEGMIEWQLKLKRVFGYGGDLLDANGCLKQKYRGNKCVLRVLVQAPEEEYLPSPNAAKDEVRVLRFRQEKDFND